MNLGLWSREIPPPQTALIAFGEIVLLPGIIRLQMLGMPVSFSFRFSDLDGFPEGVMGEEAHVFAEVDVGYSGVAADDDHVLVVGIGAGFAEIGGAGDDDGIVAQGIDEHVFRVDPMNLVLAATVG